MEDLEPSPPVAQLVKTPPAMWETWVQSLGGEGALEKGMAESGPSVQPQTPNWPTQQRTGYLSGVHRSWTAWPPRTWLGASDGLT